MYATFSVLRKIRFTHRTLNVLPGAYMLYVLVINYLIHIHIVLLGGLGGDAAGFSVELGM